MAQKPSIPKGTRDFSPVEMAKRNYIFDTIKESFRLFGYKQIETPSIENLSTLMGKYGEEGDKLLFKILNSGDFLKSISDEELLERNLPRLTNKICEKGLRYDLTVPFARFVVQHRNDLQMPFKRYQIQPVWRADRPQKGRYREFYQCDADVVGSDSLLNEVELLSLIDNVFTNLGIRIAVKINNRKVLATMTDFLKNSEVGMKGIEEMNTVLEGIESLGHNCEVETDFSLARGLNYYTGTIIEVKARDVEIGSITGGGRYDNLTGVFGMPGLSGVGISFGADRIYDVMNQLNLYPDDITRSVKVFFVNFGDKESLQAAKYVKALREAGISAQLYPDAAKMKKQMSVADADNIPFVAFVGESELGEDAILVKDMSTGEQQRLTLAQTIELLK